MKNNTVAVLEFVKGLVRPFIITTSWITILYMWVEGIEIPNVLAGVAIAIIGEYGLERAVKRWREV